MIMLPSDHLIIFQRRIKRSRRLLAKQSGLHTSGKILITELESIYELCFSQIYINFESQITELFITNLLSERNLAGRKRNFVVPKNRADALKILRGTNSYFQLLPVDRMEQTAKVYFKNGEPFSRLSTQAKTELKKAAFIRNHIAHRSLESKHKFLTKVISQASLPKSSSVPGYYLRSPLSRTVSYFDHHVSELGACIRDLSENS